MANNLIPPIGTKGRYNLHDPFGAAIHPTELYELAAERYFEDIENNGGNVYELYYKPYKLPESQVATDRANRVAILTLLTAKYPPIYVPTSFVKSYPDLNVRPYSQFILTLSLGPLPNDVILEPTMRAVANAASDFIGVTPEVFVSSLPISDLITAEDHENREVTRQAAIADRTTDYAQVRELQGQVMALSQQVALLQKICKDNGYVP